MRLYVSNSTQIKFIIAIKVNEIKQKEVIVHGKRSGALHALTAWTNYIVLL